MHIDQIEDGAEYDLVVVGGAFAGASLALLMRRWTPDSKVLIVERKAKFDRKVGEATVELSGMFLQRVLRFYDFLSREQLPKHGLRYWFSDSSDATLADMSEVGAHSVSSLPSFQLDRAKMDEAILAQAVEEGADLLRPVRVQQIETEWPKNSLVVTDGEHSRTVHCRWIVDATGRTNLLSRQKGLFQSNEEHPTSAVWCRWTGVKNMDGPELLGTDPASPKMPQLGAARRLATNHFCGYGWWCWAIPLSGGETSIGVVFDKRLFKWDSEGTPKERYLHFLRHQPGLRELLDGAKLDDEDFRAYGHLPFSSSQYMAPGWALVGDSASFLDPYYSPGLDHASLSVYATARVLQKDFAGSLTPDQLEECVTGHNRRFKRSYKNWFEGLYLNKYEIMGDAELTAASFYFDTAMYYLGVVGPAYRNIEEMNNPVLGADHPGVAVAAALMRFFRHRMVQIARFRRQVGTYGRRNRGWKAYRKRFETGPRAVNLLLAGMRIWAGAEANLFWHRLRTGWTAIPSPYPTKTQPAEVQSS